jgi:HEPN domain-containing protein
MKKQVDDWLFLARTDIDAAEIIVNEKHLTHIAAFHCQQAIEKYFKAYLINHEKELLKIHDLVKLYGMVKEIKDFNIDEEILALVNETYTETRYPGELGLISTGMPTNEQSVNFLKLAKEVESKVQKELLQ